MARLALRAGVFLEAVLWVLTAPPVAATDNQPVEQQARTVLDLFHVDHRDFDAPNNYGRTFREPKHRLYQEMDGARAQAEDWLHDAGLSLFEQRDSDGRRSYQLISGALADNWPIVKLHARIGGPVLSTGLQPKREIPALGFTIPGESYTVELEALRDRRLGSALMARIRWGNIGQRVQYGFAVPMTLGGSHSVGALFQLRIRLGD